jgi:hypothetical protein
LGLPCPEVNEFDVEPHLTSDVSYIIRDNSEPETPFTPDIKGKQRDNQQNDSDIKDPLTPASTTSTNKQLTEAKKHTTLIQQSPIGEKNPIPLDNMSTTQTAPTITMQMAMVASTTTQTLKQCIATAINTSLKRNLRSGSLGGGGSPGEGGGGGGSGGQQANPNQYQVVPVAANVCMMGSLPVVFDRTHSYAEGFIEGVQKYLHLNDDVPGFQSPMKKIVLVLTLMQGPEVEGWTADIGSALDLLDLAVNNIPALWDQFLLEFTEQY